MDLNEVMRAMKSLLLLPYPEMLEMAVLHGVAIAGSERCCIIIENKRGELVVKAGFPKSGHGIGQKIESDCGENLMRKILNNGGAVWIDKPTEDRRTQYLRPLAEQCAVSAVVFIPLFCGEPLGLMVFDFTDDQEKSLRDNLSGMKDFAEFVAIAMKVLYRQREHEEQALQQERLSSIGQNAAEIAHKIRNASTSIGLTSNILDKKIIKTNSDLKKYTEIIIKESDRITKVVGGILRFSHFSPDDLEIASHNLNEFFSKAAKQFSRVYDLRIDFCSGKEDDLFLLFDRDLLEDCVHDLVRNAKEAGARSISIKISATEDERALIVISNDGEPIPSSVIGKIFDPFITTKSTGTGLGLANVKNIITAHGGDIKAESNERQTKFIIFLPI